MVDLLRREAAASLFFCIFLRLAVDILSRRPHITITVNETKDVEMTAQLTHKTIITNTLTNEVNIIHHDFSDYMKRSPRWDESAMIDAFINFCHQHSDFSQLLDDAVGSVHTEVEIVAVSEE